MATTEREVVIERGPDTRSWEEIPRSEQERLRAPFLAAGISPSATSALMRHSGYRTPDAIRLASDAELLAVPNVGPTALAALRAAFPELDRVTPLVFDLPIGTNGRAARCGACDTPYLIGAGHGVADCIAALARRIKMLENEQLP